MTYTSTNRHSFKAAAAIVAVVLALGLLEAIQAYVGSQMRGDPYTLWFAVFHTMPGWLILLSLVPGVLFMAKRFDLGVRIQPLTLVAHMAAALAFAMIHLGGMGLVSGLRNQTWAAAEATFARLVSFYFALDLVTYWAIVGMYYAWHYYKRYRDREVVAARLQASLTEARLEALKSQLNPHFLFNTLNSISAMALKGKQEEVVETLGKLSELLRISFDDSIPQEIPLAQEMEFLRGYMEIQEIRFGDRLTIAIDIATEAEGALVPCMITQPLLENALDHGIASQRGPGQVWISARRSNGRLELEVRDSGPGFSNRKEDLDGIGLANTAARLQQLYGQDYAFAWGDTPGERGGSVKISIPFRTDSPTNPEHTPASG